jgi:uncharacterized protein YndB with AHSA1/START domain
VKALVSSIDIDRPPEEVFAYATDPSTFAQWQDDVVSAHADGDGPPTVGSTFTTTRRVGPAARTMTQQITELDPPRRWVVRGVSGPLRPGMDLAVEPRDEGRRSRATFALDFQGEGVGELLVPMVRRMAARTAPASYRRLKARLEARQPPTA